MVGSPFWGPPPASLAFLLNGPEKEGRPLEPRGGTALLEMSLYREAHLGDGGANFPNKNREVRYLDMGQDRPSRVSNATPRRLDFDL